MKNKIFVVNPSVNLIRFLADGFVREGCPEDSVFLFPNKRAVAFFKLYLSHRGKPFILPYVYAFEDWIRIVYTSNFDKPSRILSEIDQAWLVYKAFVSVSSKKRNSLLSWDRFLPWGLKLVELFRELDLELKGPSDLSAAAAVVEDRMVDEILEKLADIYNAFNKYLGEFNATTYAKIVRWIAEDLDLSGKLYHIAGFYALTRAESKIFKRLFSSGARIYWYADVEQLPLFYKRWKSDWRLGDDDLNPVGSSADVEKIFIESYSLHSELEFLAGELAKHGDLKEPDRVAIVLLDQRNLVPLLNKLPEVKTNVTMGYPLKFTSLYSLLMRIRDLLLAEREGRYPLDKVIEFLKSPYIPQDNLIAELMEKNSVFIDPQDFRDVYDRFIKPFRNASTPYDLAGALEIFALNISKVYDINNIEKGFVIKIFDEIIPVLRNSLFDKSPMSKPSLFLLLDAIFSRVSIPFEGDPLEGLQVMGLLETRLLSFDKVFILDANEGIIPSSDEINPLLPQLVKEKLELPDRIREEKIVQYHFERLIASSRKVYILWQTQITPDKSGLDNKKVKSRFVEKLIWEIEKEKQKILDYEGEDSPVTRVALKLDPSIFKSRDFVRKSESARAAVKSLFGGRITQSLLNSYLRCPLSFYYRYVLELTDTQPLFEVATDQVGKAIHEALFQYYSSLGKDYVRKKDLSLEKIFELFVKNIEKAPFYKYVSSQKIYLLKVSARERLRRFILKQPDITKVVDLECGMECQFEGYKLYGIFDRVDLRNDIVWILDYKTRYVPSGVGYKDRFLEFNTPDDYGYESLVEFYKLIRDIQLPLYMYIFISNHECESINAAYIDLYRSGEEKIYCNEKRIKNMNKWLSEVFPYMLKFLISHALYAEYWFPASDERICSSCIYRKICRYN